MSIIYFIDNTANTLSFTINPGELDGPGGVDRHTDMRLYGMGALQWGEGVDENILRLTETFTVSAKTLGDHNPYTDTNNYNPSNDPILPKSEEDISPGHGITNPLNGQLWYNASDYTVYVYDSTFELTNYGYSGQFGRWIRIGGVGIDEPSNPLLGELWYNLNFINGCLTNPQLVVYYPSHPESDIDGWVPIAADYVRQCGDYMTGELEMQAMIDMTGHRIRNVGDPSISGDVLNLGFADARFVNVTGDNMIGELNMTTNRITNLGDPILTSDALNLGFADNRFINVTGDNMTGWLELRHDIPANDWYAVPVKMLNDEIGGLTTYINTQVTNLQNQINNLNTGANQKRIYIGMVRFNLASSQTTVNYYTSCWASHYNTTYGASTTISQWRFVVIPNIERIRVSNGKPIYDSAGSLGDYGFVDYYSEAVTIDTASGLIQIRCGNTGVKTDGTSRPYSSRGYSLHRVYIIGFPPAISNYYSLPTGGGSVC